MIPRRLQVPVALTRPRPCQHQCQRHWERPWLPPPSPPRRTLTTKPLSEDIVNKLAAKSSRPRHPKRRRPTRPTAATTDELSKWRNTIFYTTPLHSIDATSTTPRPLPTTQPAVLDISRLPPSLLDSDFQRLASPGLRVDGWTRGLVKVLPSLHPHTKSRHPSGQYFLFFDTLVAARAYADALLAAPPPSILPPSLPRPRIRILPLRQLQFLLRRFYPAAAAAAQRPNLAPRPDGLHVAAFLPARDDARAASVRVRLAGSHVTAATLRAAIVRDGRGRGLPWALAGDEETGGVVPLPGSGAWVERGMFADGFGVEGGKQAKVRAFDGFVVTFEEAGEARRFVRGWHGREMLDRRNDRVMGVEVVGLW
ncbi:hypothetical protein QBC39DRAFT_408217 [Podospora conica]|nr:hypothetical protein QBC39DRAFT_408217 [Schizothecium conicum]